MEMSRMKWFGNRCYLMPDDWKDMPRPAVILRYVNGSLGKKQHERAAAVVIKFSSGRNGWVGVSYPRLIDELRSKNDDYNFIELKRAVDEMLKNGLLEIAKHKKWQRWKNLLPPKIVCLTKDLINKILANKESLREAVL